MAESRRLLAGFSGFAAATIALVGLSGGLLATGFRGPGDARALLLSAVIVVAVQLAVFAVLRTAPRNQIISFWAVGTMIRGATLVTYAFLVAKVLQMPVTAALISMAAFFFLTTVVEPLFLEK